MNSVDRIETLRRADPAGKIPDGPLDKRAREDLAEILSEASAETPPRQLVSRRTLVVGVAATTAGAVCLVVADPFGSTSTAVAATPPLIDSVLNGGRPARDGLYRLAAIAEKGTELPGDGRGPHVVRTESWSLSTRVDGRQIRSAVVPEVTELTWNADRSGHITVRTGKPYFPSADYQATWKDEGSPGKSGTVVRDETWQQGGYTPMFPNLPLPSDNDRLLATLKAGHPIDKLGTGELAVAINDLYIESQPGPAVRASLLRLLAARPDVVSLGRLTDRAGRPVEGFAIDSALTGLPQRQIMMFSPMTGTLLAAEEILTKDAGKLGVRIPSVISYRLYFPAR
jgi:hypothetical protein